MMSKVEFDELSGRIIRSAIEVHRRLGPGFLESIYGAAFVIQLHKDGLKVEVQKEIEVMYDGQVVGVHRLDLVVEDEVVVELKAVREFDNSHTAQLLSYLKATGLKVGLLLNFAKPTLRIKRVVRNW
jgi:GxxExxY protein